MGGWTDRFMVAHVAITKIHEESVTQGACGYSEDTGDRHPPCIYIRKKDSPGRLPGMGGL